MEENQAEMMAEFKVLIQRFSKILEGNGVPGLVQRVTELETNRVVDHKDLTSLITVVRSLESKLEGIPSLFNSMEQVQKSLVRISEYDQVKTKLEAHLKEFENSSEEEKKARDRKDKITDGLIGSVITFVVILFLTLLLSKFGIVSP